MRRDAGKVRKVVFLKLRKTGGTSLAASVLYPYCVKHGLAYMVPIHWFAAHPRLVEGDRFDMMFRHFPDYPQPWAKRWLNQTIGDHHVITIVRDPVERMISVFNHAAQFGGTRSLEYYFAHDHEKNHQARWLGYDGRDESFLEENFSMVGVTDRFNESMLLMRRALDLSLEDMLYIGQRRGTPKVIRREDLDERWVEHLREVDWLDFELHRKARDYVDYYLEDLPDLGEELQEYESALQDFSHPLWGRRGPFPIGYSTADQWFEFTGQHGEVKQLKAVPL